MKRIFYTVEALVAIVFLFSCKDIPDELPEEKPVSKTPSFSVQLESSGETLWNIASSATVWNYSTQWHAVMENAPSDFFRTQLPFVKYVQFFAAAGGNRQRDLFKDPLNTSITDDYDFAPLIRACRNVVRQGLIPYLKLGNVPLKFTKNYKLSADFDVNILPPDDYRVWHKYIKSLAEALIAEFGAGRVRTWRFGSVAEYENKDWFSVDNNPEKTKEAFFKLYDYTVDALQQALGENICIGAHSMTITAGLWDERDFIRHCANGLNYCTGKTGTRLSFLSTSYYEERPGVPGSGLNLQATVELLRTTAKGCGFNDLFYGIDEGRILTGSDKKPLLPRAVGHTWQAAFDASLYRKAYDNHLDYISQWDYTTNGVAPGLLPVSTQTAGLFYKMTGAKRLPVEYSKTDADMIAAWNQEENKVYLLFYAYSPAVSEKGNRSFSCRLSGLQKSGDVKAVRTLVSDDSNFYDNWLSDWSQLGVSQSNFPYWSSEGFNIDTPLFGGRQSYYESCATLNPETVTLQIKNGMLDIDTNIPVHGVLLYEIAL